MSSSQTPYREIRAHYDDETVTVYQAYSSAIAEAAVAAQRLDASPQFKTTRMTWVKPSWAWMMYRSGYSYKDKGQSRILALTMKHEHFLDLLSKGVLSTHVPETGRRHAGPESSGPREKTTDVRIQWDPERTPNLEVLPYRSIQIGIPGALSGKWVSEWIVRIEDVTDRAQALKQRLDEHPETTEEELVTLDLLPVERPFAVPDSIRERLKMN